MAHHITIEDFLSLTHHKKFDVIFTFGDFLDTRIEEELHVILYTINPFFVELYYDPKLNKIVKVAAFENGDIMSKHYKILKGDNLIESSELP